MTIRLVENDQGPRLTARLPDVMTAKLVLRTEPQRSDSEAAGIWPGPTAPALGSVVGARQPVEPGPWPRKISERKYLVNVPARPSESSQRLPCASGRPTSHTRLAAPPAPSPARRCA